LKRTSNHHCGKLYGRALQLKISFIGISPLSIREIPFPMKESHCIFASEIKRNNLKLTIMKKFILAFTALLTMAVSANAMSYEQARQQALFLTDKMAYELNLTDDQYEAAYEINLDYLMGINDYNDLYGAYWQQRNLDLSYILLDWQYNAYVDASYFYRPLYWNSGYWHFGIYARYPHRDYYFFGRPDFYGEYCGAHSWRMNNGRSWYNGRDFAGGPRGNRMGMRDEFNRGDYGRGNRNYGNNNYQNNGGNRSFGNMSRSGGMMNRSNQSTNGYSNRSFGQGSSSRSVGTGSNRSFGFGNSGNYSNRESSTRTTVTSPSRSNGNVFGGSRGGSNYYNRSSSTPSNTFTPSRSFSSPSGSTRSSSSYSGSRSAGSSFGGGSSSFGGGRSSFGGGGSSFGGGGSHGGGSSAGSSSHGGGFGGHR
jgi:hypothetical protein